MTSAITTPAEAGTPVPFIINGEHVLPAETFPVTSPATGEVVHQAASASEEHVAQAVAAAHAAFESGWKTSSPRARRDILLRAADIMRHRKDELSGYLTAETGAPKQWGDFNVDAAAEFIVDVAGRILTLEGKVPATKDEGQGAMVWLEPYGVVLAIAPWNAPYILGVRSVLFPLAAGNTAVLKGSELCPRTMWGVASVFHEAGLPAGVLNLLFHAPANAPAITQALIAHPAVKKVNFTGSTAVGRIIGKLAGEQLKPVLLELGGKAPAIVWEDADLQNAAVQCALGAFLNAGQICMSTERIIVHKAIAEQFEKAFVGAIGGIFGQEQVLINKAGVAKNKKLVEDAVAKGARVVYGDPAEVNVDSPAAQMKPIVIAGVTPEMDIYKIESFGPTVSLFEVESEEEALRIANDTEYGLSSAVFTEDLRRGLRFAKGIETGAVHINSMTVHDEGTLPHGGAKASGYGRFNAAHGLGEWVRTKSVTFKW